MAATEYLAKLRNGEAIKELRYRYGRSIDSRSWDEFLDLFTDDATCNYVGLGSFTGHEELRELAEDYIESNYEYTCHLFHHPILEVDGDEATGSWLLEALLAHHDGTFEWRQGRYTDDYRRVDGEWKFAGVSLESEAVHEQEFDLVDHEAYSRVPLVR
jgi:ketosteroid isomerase-like protein